MQSCLNVFVKRRVKPTTAHYFPQRILFSILCKKPTLIFISDEAFTMRYSTNEPSHEKTNIVASA